MGIYADLCKEPLVGIIEGLNPFKTGFYATSITNLSLITNSNSLKEIGNKKIFSKSILKLKKSSRELLDSISDKLNSSLNIPREILKTKITKVINEYKITLLIGESGVGKSAMAKQIMNEMYPNHQFILRANLSLLWSIKKN